jgi:hypothetical protein
VQARAEERGGAVKTVLVVAILIYAVFATIQVVGAKTEDKAMQKRTEEFMKFAGINRKTAKDLRYDIGQYAKESKIPLEEKDIKVEEDRDSWHVSFAYQRNLDLWLWNYQYDVKFDRTMPKG